MFPAIFLSFLVNIPILIIFLFPLLLIFLCFEKASHKKKTHTLHFNSDISTPKKVYQPNPDIPNQRDTVRPPQYTIQFPQVVPSIHNEALCGGLSPCTDPHCPEASHGGTLGVHYRSCRHTSPPGTGPDLTTLLHMQRQRGYGARVAVLDPLTMAARAEEERRAWSCGGVFPTPGVPSQSVQAYVQGLTP